jgi:putative endonuclease
VKTYHVYIMASASRVLYTGVTNHIDRRVWQHKQRRTPGFAARYNTCQLVYCQPFGDIRAAIAREKQIKGWLRSKKIALIESVNPHWYDLSAQWTAGRAQESADYRRAVILSEAKNPSDSAGRRDSSARKPASE